MIDLAAHARVRPVLRRRDETWMRRRLMLFDAMRYAVPRVDRAATEVAAAASVRAATAQTWFSPGFLEAALRASVPARPPSIARSTRAHARAVYIEARSKYHVQCMEWNNKVGALHGLDAAFPFLDRDLIAFLMAIPGEIHARDGVPRVLLREAMRDVMPDSIRARTWKSDFSPFVNMGLRQDAEAILRTLDCRMSGRAPRLSRRERVCAPELARLSEGLNRDDCADSWESGGYLWSGNVASGILAGMRKRAPRSAAQQERA